MAASYMRSSPDPGAQPSATLRSKGLLHSARSPWSVLRHRDFLLLVGGTLVSHTGDILQSMAVSWLVFELTHSAFKLGLLGFCWMLPRLLFGALGGVVVDRVDRRR